MQQNPTQLSPVVSHRERIKQVNHSGSNQPLFTSAATPQQSNISKPLHSDNGPTSSQTQRKISLQVKGGSALSPIVHIAQPPRIITSTAALSSKELLQRRKPPGLRIKENVRDVGVATHQIAAP